MTRQRLRELLEAIARQRLLVLGDAMLDEYIWGVAERISPEAPVMVVRCQRVTRVPGGAANVYNSVRALGAAAGLAAVVGTDEAGRQLAEQLTASGAEPLVLVEDPARPTTIKTRVVAHSQQVVRIDREERRPLEPPLAAELTHRATSALEACDGLLLSDYDKGVLTPANIPDLLAAAAARGLPVAVNAKPHHADCYRGVTLVTVNRVEAEAIAGEPVADVAAARRVASLVVERLGAAHALVTLGPEGAVLAGADGAEHVPAIEVQVYDTAGAGDTSIAAAHLALCAGASPREAVELAMRAAAVVVSKVGVQTSSPAEILALDR